MAEFIPDISLTDFLSLARKQGKDGLKRLKSCEVTFNGEYLFTFLNPQTDYIRKHVEYLAQSGNALSGETPEQILKHETLEV